MGENLEHNLIGEAVRDPEGLKQRCVSTMAEAEQQRADTLIRAGADKNAAAASIALYRACLLNPESEVARRRFQEVCSQHQLDYGSLEKDPRFAELAAEMQSQRTPAPGLLKRAAELARANKNPFLHAVYLKQYLKKRPNDSVASQQLQVLLGWTDDALKDPTSTAASIVAPGLSQLNTQQLIDGLRTGGFKSADRAGEEQPKLQSASSNMVVSHQSAQERMVPERPGPSHRSVSHVGYAEPGLAEMLQSWIKPAIGLSLALLVVGGGFKLMGSFISDTRDSVQSGVQLSAQKASQHEDKRGLTEMERLQADKVRRGKVRADYEDWRNAVMLLDAAMAMDPRSPQGIEALLERGRVHMKSGNLVQARKDFDLVITRAGDDAVLSQEARAELLKLAAEQERADPLQEGPATGRVYRTVPSDAVR
jgi:tetratricopeptide (TPR) repeat protein